MTKTPPTAIELKGAALNKLSEAHTLILSAREDLCNLEGPGYCQSYETILAAADQLNRQTIVLRRLIPPTGLFVI